MAPAVAETTAQIVKKERNFKKKVDPWVWHGFNNPARGDELTLHHWMKEQEKEEVYHFARFNRKVEVVHYTPEEYEQAADSALPSSDWSHLETDHLFRLCEKYSLRFIIIADRFEDDIDASEEERLLQALPIVAKKRDLKAKDKDAKRSA